MYRILLSALYRLGGFFLQQAVLQFILFGLLFLVITLFTPYIANLLPGASHIKAAFAGQASGIWYFLTLFMVPDGIKIITSAALTAFIIRRIPLIG